MNRSNSSDLRSRLDADSDVEKIFEKGDEGMHDAEGFIKQMVRCSATMNVVAELK